jgi:hypothetical protein
VLDGSVALRNEYDDLGKAGLVRSGRVGIGTMCLASARVANELWAEVFLSVSS